MAQHPAASEAERLLACVSAVDGLRRVAQSLPRCKHLQRGMSGIRGTSEYVCGFQMIGGILPLSARCHRECALSGHSFRRL